MNNRTVVKIRQMNLVAKILSARRTNALIFVILITVIIAHDRDSKIRREKSNQKR